MAATDQGLDLLSGDEWYDLILPIIFAYNSTVNRMTGHSPMELYSGQPARFPIDLALSLEHNHIECTGTVEEYMRVLRKHKRVIFEDAVVRHRKYDAQRKKYYDKDVVEREFAVGDLVAAFNVNKKGKVRKFSQKWVGIWRIIALRGGRAAKLEEVRTHEIAYRNIAELKHIDWVVDQQF